MSNFRLFKRYSTNRDKQDAITDLYDYSVLSREGEAKNIGTVKKMWLSDIVGDEGFISVSTGWLFGRLYLIPTDSLKVDELLHIIRVPYTEEKVKGGPILLGERDMTNEEAIAVKHYYGLDTLKVP